MVELTEKKVFSCKDCGKPFEVHPPDDKHIVASVEEQKDSVPRTYKCKGGHKNTIYWYEEAGPHVR